MLAASGGAAEHVVRSGIAIKPQQPENAAGAAAHDVELPVGGDQFVGEQPRSTAGIGEQAVIAEAFRDHRKRIDDRAEAGRAADAERARQTCGIAAFQILAQMRQRRAREFGGWRVPGHGGMGGEKNGDPRSAVIKIGTETNELEDIRIAKPIEPDPGRARSAADGAFGNFAGDLVGFGEEQARRDGRHARRTHP